MINVLNLLFSQDFLIRALVVGVLISLCSSLLGVSLVLKRFSMIGDGLSHVGFGAMAIACAVNIAPLYFALPIVIVAAFLLLKMSENGKIKGDAAIALISTGSLAVGVMATSMTTGMNVDIYNYMFGSILTMSDSDVAISTVLSCTVIVLFVIFYNEIFAVTFDESFAKATGTKVSLYNMLIAALTAVTIVIGMRMMGALLISSLIIFPTVTSMRLCKSFKSVILSSAFVSVFCFISGLILSIKFEAPTGASVVCFNIFMLGAFSVIRLINKKYYGKSINLRKILLFLSASAFTLVYFAFMFYGTSSDYYKKEKISVVTTTFAQYDFAKNIVGEKGDVAMLLSPGEESHTYEPTPGDIMKIKDCDLFIYGGGESEKWVESILSSFNEEILCVRMMEVTELCEENDDGILEHGHEHSHDESQEHMHNDETVYDEHVWTSPLNAIAITEAINSALCKAYPDYSGYFNNNTANYVSKLKELDNSFINALKDKKRDYIVVGDRFPLRYLTQRYSLGYFAAFPGCSAQVEANPVTVASLIDKVSEEKIPVIFKVDLSKGDIAYTVSESTGAEVLTLYSCHVISAEDYNNDEDYISLMMRNVENISAALK